MGAVDGGVDVLPAAAAARVVRAHLVREGVQGGGEADPRKVGRGGRPREDRGGRADVEAARLSEARDVRRRVTCDESEREYKYERSVRESRSTAGERCVLCGAWRA